MLLTRRSLLGGIGALLAAPAIVRASSLMPVKSAPGFAQIHFFQNLACNGELLEARMKDAELVQMQMEAYRLGFNALPLARFAYGLADDLAS